MTSQVLVLNCGSSSVKFAVIDTEGEAALLTGLAERLGGGQASLSWRRAKGEKQTRALAEDAPDRAFHATDHEAAMRAIVGLLRDEGLVEKLGGVGHRVVHGGERFTASTLVTREVIAGIERCVPHAPLHNHVGRIFIRHER